MIRVLITDDRQHVRQGLRMLLSTIPILEVSGEARDGEEAIQKASQLQADLLIMDVHMPGRDGVSATSEIKRMLPNTLVILISIENGELRKKSIAAGAFAFVEKSSGQAALLAEVNRAIQVIGESDR